MTKRTSFNISEENDAYLRQLGGSMTDIVNNLIDQLRSGQIEQVKTDGTDLSCIYNMTKLGAPSVDLQCPIKGHYPDLAQPSNKERLLKFCGKCPRHLEHTAFVKLQIKYPKPFEAKPEPTYTPDEEKKTPTIEPVQQRGHPSRITEIPAGQALVGCDSCNERFIFDDIDNGLDEFTAHLKEKHGGRNVSNNEANQFRHARTRLEKAANVA